MLCQFQYSETVSWDAFTSSVSHFLVAREISPFLNSSDTFKGFGTRHITATLDNLVPRDFPLEYGRDGKSPGNEFEMKEPPPPYKGEEG